MRKIIYYCILLSVFFLNRNSFAQESTEEGLGLPGDNLNLYAVLKLFQESETLEGFERNLNDENSKINNIDLDGDDQIDYIKVIDYIDGEVHTIVLQVAVSATETQDVAVFTVQRDAKDQVQIQLTGDEALYGKDYIIEPIFETTESSGETPNPGYMGGTQTVDGQTVIVYNTTTVEIARWPVVRFIYLPEYIVWHSPWYYGYYPSWWSPWRPYYWHYYSGYHNNWNQYYYGHYRHWHHHRYSNWNNSYYHGRRSYSGMVNKRKEEGTYNKTYSRPDLKKEGSNLYYKMNPGATRQPANKEDNGPGVNKRKTPPPGNNTSTKPGGERKSTKPGVINRSKKPGGDKKSTRPSTIKQSGKPAIKKSPTKSGSVKTNSKSSGNTGKSKSGRIRK